MAFLNHLQFKLSKPSKQNIWKILTLSKYKSLLGYVVFQQSKYLYAAPVIRHSNDEPADFMTAEDLSTIAAFIKRLNEIEEETKKQKSFTF